MKGGRVGRHGQIIDEVAPAPTVLYPPTPGRKVAARKLHVVHQVTPRAARGPLVVRRWYVLAGCAVFALIAVLLQEWAALVPLAFVLWGVYRRVL